MPKTAAPESLEGRIGRHSNPSSPNSIMQSDLPQVPLEQWGEPPKLIIGFVAGKDRDVGETEVSAGSGETSVFPTPEQTQFVMVIEQTGETHIERFDPQIHGPIGDIPTTGLTPPELLELIRGFGEEETDQGQLFERIRKAAGGASREHWAPGYNPKPRKP